jgi:hypothetical protein
LEKIKIHPHVKYKLIELVEILYDEEYFGFKENAVEYVRNIYRFIYSIPNQRHRKAKKQKFGDFYCPYKYNKQTTYYIFFDKEADLYFVRHVTNNHSPDYPNLV